LGCGTGAPSEAQFCPRCGLRLAPTDLTAALPAAPATPYPAGGGAVAGFGADAARPLGIVILALTEVVVAVVGLFVVLDYAYSANWRFSYDEPIWGVLDGALALAYLSASVAGFALISGLWSLRPWTWLPAVRLSCSLIGLGALSVALWGLTPINLVGLTVQVGVLSYLNFGPVRALFGRPPLAFLQGPG
jgi:energy-converting hydrogenase Eha subunit A